MTLKERCGCKLLSLLCHWQLLLYVPTVVHLLAVYIDLLHVMSSAIHQQAMVHKMTSLEGIHTFLEFIGWSGVQQV